MAIPIEMYRATRATGIYGRYLRPLWNVYVTSYRLIVVDSFFVFATLFMPIVYALLALGMLRNKGGDYAIYVVIGSGLAGLWTTLLFSGGNSISSERWTGTLETLAAAPLPLWLVVFGKNLASVTQALLSIVVSYVLGSFLFGYPLTVSQPIPFFVSLVLTIISFIFFGLMLAPLFVLNPSVQRFQNAMEYPVYILCGFLFPVLLLPIWTLPISYVLSPYWAANALHWTSSGGGTTEQLALSWVMMIILSVVYLIIAAVVFRIVAAKRGWMRLWECSDMKQLWINLRLFWQGAVLSYIALFHWLKPVTYLASMVIFPLGQIMFFTLLGMYATGTQTASYYLIGNSMQLTAGAGIFGVTMAVGEERWAGTLPYLFGTPANRLALFFGRSLVHILNGTLQVIMGLTWGLLLGWVDFAHTDFLALAITILVATISTAGMGLLLGCIGLVTLNIMFINNLVYFLLLLLCGVNVPVAELPQWMQVISYCLPLTRGIQAARLVIAGASLAQVAPLLLGEAAVGAAYIAVGYALFRFFEAEAKRRGTLEAF